jgi:TPR repeat protein
MRLPAIASAVVFAVGIAGSVLADPFQDGVTAAVRGDYATAFKLWQPLADAGAANAENNLGALYAHGLGVAADDSHAFKLYRAAADQGLADAENNLGYAYELGLGVPKDVAMALKWYQAAADQGNDRAELNLGLFYENGVAVPKDLIAAAMWLGLASSMGQEPASTELRKVILQLAPDQVAEARQRMAAWKPTNATTPK